MINADLLTDLILKMDAFRMKKGQDTSLKRDLITAINAFIGEDSLDTIYINSNDHMLVPDVFVMPIYNKDFGAFIMNPRLNDNCPYGYTLEIKTEAFDKYTAEELTAIIIHHIMQNVQSACAKARFLGAYTKAIEDYSDDVILDMFTDISHSEVCYIAFLDICARPFNVPVSNYDYTGTDCVLVSVGLADAFDSALMKMRALSNDSPEDQIDIETEKDYRTLGTIIKACVNNDIRHYYEMIKTSLPLVTLQNVIGKPASTNALGFASRKKDFKHRYPIEKAAPGASPIVESVMNPKNEIELRFQIDKIVVEMRYLETEGERQAILFRIKNLRLKMMNTKKALQKKLDKHPADENLIGKMKYVDACIDELEDLRKQVVKKVVTPKHYGVFVQYPAGYEY